MFMPCPHCGFLVALILPRQATGPRGAAVHCPRCERALQPEPPEPTDTLDGAAGADSRDPVAGSEAERTDSAPPAAMDAAEAAEAADPGAGLADRGADSADAVTKPSAAGSGRARRTPSFVRGHAPATTSRVAWPWYAAIVALGLVLALQLLLAQRHELAASARWRPWVEGLCSTLACAIPAWREPHAFTMLERSVQPSPAMPGVLAVEAHFRNDARWPQPWPTLVLSLSDAEGRQVGLRAFAPSQYRAGAARTDDLLAPGQSATVRLQVREPSPRIVAFTFDFQ